MNTKKAEPFYLKYIDAALRHASKQADWDALGLEPPNEDGPEPNTPSYYSSDTKLMAASPVMFEALLAARAGTLTAEAIERAIRIAETGVDA